MDLILEMGIFSLHVGSSFCGGVLHVVSDKNAIRFFYKFQQVLDRFQQMMGLCGGLGWNRWPTHKGDYQ